MLVDGRRRTSDDGRREWRTSVVFRPSSILLCIYLLLLPIYCLLRVFGLAGPMQVMTFVIPVTLCAFSVAHAIETRGLKTAVLFFASGALISLGTELIGTATGLLFGNYTYAERMGYRLFGLVPWLIPVAWCSMLYPAWCVTGFFLEGRDNERDKGTRGQGDRELSKINLLVSLSPCLRIILSAFALTAWDLSLDPRMVQDGNWVWHGGGIYFGVPLSNYVGWVVTAALVYLVWGILEFRFAIFDSSATDSIQNPKFKIQNLPVWAYIFVWLGESMANVLFWAGPWVGLCVFVGMGVFAIPALRQLVRPMQAQPPAHSRSQAAGK